MRVDFFAERYQWAELIDVERKFLIVGLAFKSTIRDVDFPNFYLRQRDYVMTGVCLFVCLSVCQTVSNFT